MKVAGVAAPTRRKRARACARGQGSVRTALAAAWLSGVVLLHLSCVGASGAWSAERKDGPGKPDERQVDGPEFLTRYDTVSLRKYYSPVHMSNGFRDAARNVSSRKLFICPGAGRTATTTLMRMFDQYTGIKPLHFVSPVTMIPAWLLPDPNKEPPMPNPGVKEGDLTALFGFRNTSLDESEPLAVLDSPVSAFGWDLMESFPNFEVLLTLREPNEWADSYQRLVARRGGSFPNTPYGRLDYSASYAAPVRRQLLRRYYETNTWYITSTPEERLKVFDIPSGKCNSALVKEFQRLQNEWPPTKVSAREVHVAKSNAISKNITTVFRHKRRKARVIHRPELGPRANEVGLDLLRYMTPYSMSSDVFFLSGRKVSRKPMIIAAGFPGTGLQALLRGLATLGKDKAMYPFMDVAKYQTHHIPGRQLNALMEFGLQSPEFTPKDLEAFDVLAGQPLPLFLWDLLEAFPNAKVILTVRGVDSWWNTISTVNEGRGYHGPHSELMNLWCWGLRNEALTKRHATRRYLMHNSKVIHGIPRDRLLVWNLYAQPTWSGLTEFLGAPFPRAGFPKPLAGEF